jgi:molybdopterin-guanine dinucleotide biosynthesis protein A
MSAMVESRAAAIVLAGGKSRRLGRDKASEPLLGVPLLQRVLDRLSGVVSEFVVVTAPGQVLPELTSPARLTVVEDVYPGAGPLGGLFTGLRAVSEDVALAVACDMPLVAPELAHLLLSLIPGHDAVVPVADGRLQPLCAAYARSCIEPMQRRLDAGELKLTALLDDLDVVEVPPEAWRPLDSEGLSFLNVNREEDLARAEALLGGAARLTPPTPGPRCEVWYGNRRCGRPATHRTRHSGIHVCAVDAAVWGALYEEVEEPGA